MNLFAAPFLCFMFHIFFFKGKKTEMSKNILNFKDYNVYASFVTVSLFN